MTALDRNIDFQYFDQPLLDVIDDVNAQHGFPIRLARRTMAESGIGTDTPVNINLSGIPLGSALRLMLSDLGLAYVVQDHVLKITTQADANAARQVHVYEVDGLTQGKSEDGMLRLLEKMFPEDEVAVAVFGERLVVKASFDEHQPYGCIFEEDRFVTCPCFRA